jgi:hypothetical protein
MRTTHDLPPVSPVMLVKSTTLVVLMLLFRPRSAWNNPQPVRAIYGTEADLFPSPADAGTWHIDNIPGEADS